MGKYTFTTLAYTTGPAGDDYPQVDLVSLVTTKSSRQKIPIPTTGFPELRDYRQAKITRERTIVFSESADGNTFYIDGKEFDINRTDYVVQLGSIEKWNVVNTADEDHFFHIHQLDFQVAEVNGKQIPFYGYQDTCQMPLHSTIVLYLPFLEPVIKGKFVVHCHILGHEIAGMMATIVVK